MNSFLDTVTNWLAGHHRITAALIVSGHERGKPSKPDAYLLKHRELYDDVIGNMLCRALELMDLGDVREGV